jgi:hypothetical protein
VLLIAAANVAKLQLCGASRTRLQTAPRRRDATRLVRQLAEGLAIGARDGECCRHVGHAAVVAASPIETPRLAEARIDGTVVVFSLVVTLATSLACSVLPALQASRIDLHGMLKEGGRSVVGAQRRLHRALVVAEVALSLLLLAGAGLLVKSFVRLQRVDPGFGGPAVAMDLSLTAAHGDVPHARGRSRRSPAVSAARRGSAGLTTHLPLSGESGAELRDHGRRARAPSGEGRDSKRSERYFEAMG